MTHKELVERAAKWLRNTKGYSVVLAEIVTAAQEVPDAIGWKLGHSILVECKSSRADFMRDRLKQSRQTGTHVGSACYYMVPAGLITKEEVPSYWGLLEVSARSVKVTKRANSRPLETPEDYKRALSRQQDEIIMLTSALRRKQK